jgi:hypothetical protein
MKFRTTSCVSVLLSLMVARMRRTGQPHGWGPYPSLGLGFDFEMTTLFNVATEYLASGTGILNEPATCRYPTPVVCSLANSLL